MHVTVVDFAGPNKSSRTVRSLRVLDLVLVVCSVPIWAPLLAIIGAAVAATSGFPVLFNQERIGKDGSPFTMLKFRSMTNRPSSTSLIPSDEDITKIGMVLRRSSLDELPQLLNVLSGKMSLVGPRPMLPIQSAELTADQQLRHRVRPGMTGLAQVRGRNSISWTERIEIDKLWVNAPTVRLYLSILFQTFGVVRDAGGTTGHCASDPIAEPAARQAA